ncbi:hypothetical protein BDW59DRAFT_178958 [Aspergillus cavernicola]|uniref:FAD-binding PCMH-type domain-containing protein n=1 Tax=Aspergillus cavernicola TaxID=176166 RepID=A0ABR4IMA2_9EURO
MKYLAQLVGTAIAILTYATPSTAVTSQVEYVTPPKEVSCACRKLALASPRRIVLPGSNNYTTQATDSYWDIRAALSPACVFLPNSADEISTAMRIIGSCDAPFAVRGGGHMNIPGSNNIDGGVLLALDNFNQITVTNSSNTVAVGPGQTWYDVYSALDPYGRVAVGGRLKTIGVPGLTLIGGFHYFNNKYGFAMDNVISYDVVLGNGTQVTATRSSHGELFWALKGGGGNNFGIVTRFVLRTFEAPRVTTTIQVFNESAVPGFLSAVVEAAKLDDGEDTIAAGMVATVTYNTTTKSVSASLLGVQEGASMPPSQFANFSSISTVARNNVTTLKEFAATLDTPMQMFRIVFVHKTIKADAEALISIYEAWREAVEQISDVEGLSPTFVPNVISPAAARVAKSNGIGNVWGLEEEPLIIWQFSTGWAHARDDLRVESWSRLLSERLHAINQEKGIASEFIYMGDAGEWQDPFAGFPEENVARLKTVQRSYDPSGVFTRLNWGGFTLSV